MPKHLQILGSTPEGNIIVFDSNGFAVDGGTNGGGSSVSPQQGLESVLNVDNIVSNDIVMISNGFGTTTTLGSTSKIVTNVPQAYSEFVSSPTNGKLVGSASFIGDYNLDMTFEGFDLGFSTNDQISLVLYNGIKMDTDGLFIYSSLTNNDTATAKLDIDGDLRIRQIDASTSGSSVLMVGNDGVVTKSSPQGLQDVLDVSNIYNSDFFIEDSFGFTNMIFGLNGKFETNFNVPGASHSFVVDNSQFGASSITSGISYENKTTPTTLSINGAAYSVSGGAGDITYNLGITPQEYVLSSTSTTLNNYGMNLTPNLLNIEFGTPTIKYGIRVTDVGMRIYDPSTSTLDAEAKLDIDGDLRVRSIPTSVTNTDVLTVDLNGSVSKATISGLKTTEISTSMPILTPDIGLYRGTSIVFQNVNIVINKPTNYIATVSLTLETYIIKIKDNGTSKTIEWDTSYIPIDVILPTSTVGGKILYVEIIYNGHNDTWDVVKINQQL